MDIKNEKLLSICIPTWNRVNALQISLNALFTEINDLDKTNRSSIEVIISDNASDDDTKNIVTKVIEEFPNVDSKYNRNCENINFYGNVKKIRELSNGKYCWILSDDEVISDKILPTILENLNKNTFSFLHLAQELTLLKFQIIPINANRLLKTRESNAAFVSTMIFENDKSNDNFIHERFDKNDFIAFVYFLNSALKNIEGLIICGKCFKIISLDERRGFNWFSVFTTKINEVFTYYKTHREVNKGVNYLKNRWVTQNLRSAYIYFRLNKHDNNIYLQNKRFDVENLIRDNFKDTINYWLIIFPLSKTPTKVMLQLFNFYKKMFTK